MSASEILRKRALKRVRNGRHQKGRFPEAAVFFCKASTRNGDFLAVPCPTETQRKRQLSKSRPDVSEEVESMRPLSDTRNRNDDIAIFVPDVEVTPKADGDNSLTNSAKRGSVETGESGQDRSPTHISTREEETDKRIKVSAQSPATRSNVFSHRRKTSSSSDSGFDSSCTPPTDRKGSVVKTNSLPLKLECKEKKPLIVLRPESANNSTAGDESIESADRSDDAVNLPTLSNGQNAQTKALDNSAISNGQNSKPKTCDNSSSLSDKGCASEEPFLDRCTESNNKDDKEIKESPVKIKSILKSPTSDRDSSRHVNVSRSQTFSYGTCARNSEAGKQNAVSERKPVRKSISFSSYDTKSYISPDQEWRDAIDYLDMTLSHYSDIPPTPYFGSAMPQVVNYVQRPVYKRAPRPFKGMVQNYPYNARWTWKPVARSRTLRPAQPRPIIIRHAAPGRHPSQRPVVMYQSIGRNEAYLRLLANQLLSKDESEEFKDALHNFRLSKSIPKLCSDLRPIITTVDKMILLVEISNRLPSHLRQDFHRLCSLQFDNYNEVLRSMSPGKRFQEKAKVIAQDSSGAIRVLAKGNQKTLVFTSQADHEAMRRNAVSASENSFNMDQTSSLFKDNESYRMFRKSESSENSEDTLFASLNETNNAIYSDPRTYGDNKTGVYSTPMQLGSSLDSSTASESFETFRHKYNKTQHPQMNGRGIVGPPIPSSGLAFRPAVRHVTLTRSGRNSLGISIKGGKEHNTTISVQTVEQGSQAEKKGLSPGDVILEVNGYSFQNISHTRAVEIIKSLHNLHLTVTKPRLQPTTVKMERNLGEAIPVHRLAEVDLTVMATKEGGLGFSLSGGADQTSSPVVTDVFKNSPAEKAGLEPGDRVLKILGIDVKDLTHKQIVSLATSSRVLKLRIQRRVQEQARSALYNGTIHAGNHVGGLLSLPNGDGPQFASSPVIRRKSQSTMSIDGDDKENNNNNLITSGFVNQSSKPRNIFNVSNSHHGHNIHDVHNFKVHAEQTHVSRFEDSDFPSASNARRKYVKRREQTAPPAFREPTYSTYIHRQSVPSYEQGGYHGHAGSNRSLERRSHYSSAGDVSRSPHSTLQRSRSPFPSFIVVPTPNDVNTRAALKDGLDKRNKTLQTVGNVYPSSTDADWKI